MASTTSPRGRIDKPSRSDDGYMQRQHTNTDKTDGKEELVCMWSMKTHEQKNHCCWAPFWLLCTETKSTFANSRWHGALASSIVHVEMMQKWCARGRKPWKDTGTAWEGNWREKTDSGGRVDRDQATVLNIEWAWVICWDGKPTFSTSAFVTLISASILSKYWFALSASLQSLSNFLLY